MAELTRNRIMELGLTAAQAGFTDTDELERCITRGMRAEWRIPLAQKALSDVTLALKGLVDE